MLRSPIYAIVGAVVLVLAVGAVALYGIGEDGVQQSRTPPAVLDKLRLTHHQADRRNGDRGERRGERRRNRGDGERGERRRNRGDGARGERRRDRGDGERGERRRRDRWDDDTTQTGTPQTGTPPSSPTADSIAPGATPSPGTDAGSGTGDTATGVGTGTAPTASPTTDTAQNPPAQYDRRAERRGDRRGERGDRRRRGGGAVSVAWEDANGRRVQLSDFRGRFVVLNLWATWCAPCVTELPALARVQTALARDNVVVLAIDLEKQEPAKVAEFLKAHGAGALAVYIDKELALMRGFRAYALPLTILYDKNGREFGRAEGPQKWDDPAAIEYLRDMADVDVTAGNDRREGRNRREDRVPRGLFRMFRWFGN